MDTDRSGPGAPRRDRTLVSMRGVSMRFGAQTVLDDVSFDVPAGQTAVVLGRSGVGKSVLLKLIVGLLRPASGQIYFDDIDMNALPERKLSKVQTRIGVVFQGAALFDSMSVYDNVAFGLRENRRGSEDDIRRIVEARLGLVGMEGAADKMPAELSGGMQKRVGLARALAMDPELLLYDEPTSGLDPVTSDIINSLIERARDSTHTTSMVVTHDMTSARRVGDRFLMLHGGRIVFDGDAAALDQCNQPEVRRFIEGRAGDEER